MVKQNSKLKTKNSINEKFTILPLGLLIITLYVDTKSEDPFNTPKLLVVLITGCLLFTNTIISGVKNFNNLPRLNRALILSVVIFNCAQILSLIVSNNFYVSFFGDSQRKNGFLFYFCLSIILVHCCLEINFTKAEKIIKLVVTLGLIMSIYGTFQIHDLDPINWLNPYNSMLLTLGNPNFASAFLAIIWIVVFICLHQKILSPKYNPVLVVILLLCIYCIFESRSRQGLVTIAMALCFYICIFFYLKFRKYFILIISINLIFVIFMIAGMLQKGPFEGILYKDSVSVRGYYWRAGINMFIENPLLGVGLDNYGSYFKEFREAEYSLKYGFVITSSNAHNVIIQLFSTGGIFVGLSYLLLILFTLIIGIKLIKRTDGSHQKVAFVFFTAWVAYLAQSFISIDFIVLPLFGWVFAGVLGGLYFSVQYSEVRAPNLHSQNLKSKKIGRDWLINYGVTLILLICLTPILLGLNKGEKEAYLLRATPNSITTDVSLFANQILVNPLADPFYKYKAVLRLYEIGNSNLAEIELKKLLDSDPRNIYYLEALAYYKFQENDVLEAIKVRNKISEVDPWNAENYYYLVNLHLLRQDTATASSLKSKILSFAANSEYGSLVKQVLP